MKAIKLFAFACMALIMASCGSNPKTKDLKVATTFSGDPEMAENYSNLLEIVDKPAVFSLEKISKDDSGKAFDEQKWSVEVSVKVKSDEFKSKSTAAIQAEIPALTLNILNSEDKEILGLKDFKIEGDNLTKFCELIAQGKDAEGTIVFTHSTNNSDDCDKWFDDEAAGAQIIVAKVPQGGNANVSDSSSNNSSVNGPSTSDNEIAGGSGNGAGFSYDEEEALNAAKDMYNEAADEVYSQTGYRAPSVEEYGIEDASDEF